VLKNANNPTTAKKTKNDSSDLYSTLKFSTIEDDSSLSSEVISEKFDRIKRTTTMANFEDPYKLNMLSQIINKISPFKFQKSPSRSQTVAGALISEPSEQLTKTQVVKMPALGDSMMA